MIYFYSLGFDLAAAPNSSFSLSVQRVATGAAVTVTAADVWAVLGAGKSFPVGVLHTLYYRNPTTPLSTITISSATWAASNTFIQALNTATYTKTQAASWETYLVFTLGTNGKLTISAANGSTQFYILPNNAATQWILGHNIALGTTGTVSRAGSWAMKYCIVPTIQYPSDDSGIYEDSKIASLAVPCSGALPYGYSRGYCSASHDWKHRGEPKSSIYGYSSTSYPFGFDFMYQHCRIGYPFVVYNDVGSYPVYFLKPESSFHPNRMWGDDDTAWDVSIRAQYIGHL